MQTELPLSALVVSIHDVSTVTRESVQRILDDLSEVGVSVTSLLVIPDHHHRGDVGEDAGFSLWLRRQAALGHETVLHGFHHLRPIKSGEGIITRLITRSYTAGEGEFYDLDFETASCLLLKGREALKRCGLEPEGFIAPAWLLGDEAERAVRKEGFVYTTRIGEVIDCVSHCIHPSRSLVYSVRAAWRRSLSLIWNAFLFKKLQQKRLLRLGIHPPDWDHESIRSQILDIARKAASCRRVMTYGEWVAEWREDSLDRSPSSVQ